METIAPIHPLLAEAVAAFDAEREKLLSLQSLCIDAAAVAAELNADGVPCHMRVSQSNNGSWITMNGVTDMASVVSARRCLARHGYHVEEDGHTDYPMDHRFTVSHVRPGVNGVIILGVYFGDTTEAGAMCRYVQTGTKTVPTFALKCGE